MRPGSASRPAGGGGPTPESGIRGWRETSLFLRAAMSPSGICPLCPVRPRITQPATPRDPICKPHAPFPRRSQFPASADSPSATRMFRAFGTSYSSSHSNRTFKRLRRDPHGKSPRCCSLPTTIPGATPCSSAKARTLHSSKEGLVRNLCHARGEIRKSDAQALASSSISVPSPTVPSTNTAFLLCSRICAASWKKVNQRWSSDLCRALSWITAFRGESHLAAPLTAVPRKGRINTSAHTSLAAQFGGLS